MESFSNDISSGFPLDGRPTQSLSRDDILKALLSAPKIYPIAREIFPDAEEVYSGSPKISSTSGVKIARISSSVVVKYGTSVQIWEARNMVHAREICGLRVPKVFDAWEVSMEPVDDEEPVTCAYIVMEYISGRRLYDIWPDTTNQQRDEIFSQLRDMYNSLHKHKLDKPGPIGGGISHGFYFTEYGAGPFNSICDMEAWFDERLQVCKDYRRAGRGHSSFSGKFHDLFLCHMDIHTQNVIIDDQDQAWLLDWGLSGAYPPYFEIRRLQILGDPFHQEFTQGLLSFMDSGIYKEEIASLDAITFALTTGVLLKPRA